MVGNEGAAFNPRPLLSDAPAGIADDAFFKNDRVFYGQLQLIASAILKAAEPSGPPQPSATVALYGPWGRGKSSALRVIRGLIEKADPETLKRICFVDYYAPCYAAFCSTVRAGIAFEVLRALDPDNESKLMEDLRKLSRMESNPDAADLSAARGEIAQLDFQKALERVTATPFKLEQWAMLTRASLGGSGTAASRGRVAVVCVDELDRCDQEYTAAFLSATHYWSTIPNLFFLVAADKRHLADSVAHRGGTESYPGESLEKYVQFGVEVPPLLNTPGARYTFLREALNSVSLPEKVAAALMAYLADTTPMGLLDPLFVASPSGVNPRGIKRAFNTLVGELQGRADVIEEDIKYIVIKVVWPDFYDEILRPAGGRNPNASRVLQQLESLGRDALVITTAGGDIETAKHVAKQLATKRRIDLTNVDELLVLYLGLGPELSKSALASLSDPETGKGPARPEDPAGPTPRTPRTGGPSGSSAGQLLRVASLEDQLLGLYVEVEAAESRRDTETVEAKLREYCACLTSNRASLNAGLAAQVGNVALTAEAIHQNDLAEILFELALELDPDHANNMQNYVSFIVDAGNEQLYDRAADFLAKLKKEPNATHRPARTALLEQQLELRRGGAHSDQWAATQAADFRANESRALGDYQTLLRLFDQAGVRSEIQDVALAMLEKVNSDRDTYRVLRSAADALADGDDEQSGQAADIYRFLLDTGLACPPNIDVTDRAEMLHNLATIMYKLDYDDLAGVLWWQAYRDGMTEGTVRRAYAQYLLRAKRPDAAEQVAGGQPLEECILDKGKGPVPERLSTAQAWWTAASVHGRGGCWDAIRSHLVADGD